MSWKTRCLCIVLIALAVTGIIIYVILIIMEQRLLFLPQRKILPKSSHPRSEHFVDGRIHSWHFDGFPGRKTVFFCHGNSCNITQRNEVIELMKRQRLNLFLFDYRGYGRSKGNPSRKGIREDGMTAFKYLSNIVDPKDIILWGESLGTSVATHIARDSKCFMLVLMGAFSDLEATFLHHYDSFPARILAKIASRFADTLPVSEWIREINCPLAIMHSTEDEIIPFVCAEEIYRNSPSKCKILIPIKGKHASPEISDEQLEKLFNFCGVSAEICMSMIKPNPNF